MELKEAIAVLKKVRHWIDYGAGELEPTANAVIEAIDTVVAELEKPLPTDEELKEQGNLTYRVLLRALNLKFEKGKVTFSEKELRHWFETGQHLKEWKEWDTL